MEITSLFGLTAKGIIEAAKLLYGYYNLKEYLTTKYVCKFKPEKLLTIEAYSNNSEVGDQIFWNHITNKTILSGQYIRLLNYQLSPWFPRKPGVYWSKEAQLARNDAFTRIKKIEDGAIIFDTYGKALMVELGGIGTVNFRKDRDKILVTATSSGITERGIPLLMERKIWDKITPEFKSCQRLEVDLEGIIEYMPLEYDKNLIRSPYIPKLVLKVESVLNIKRKISDLDIYVSPWTIFETSNKKKPYCFTYKNHNLLKDDMESDVNWLKNYANDNNGTLIVSDFDESINYLNAEFPLNSTIDNIVNQKKLLKYIQQLRNKFNNSGENL